MELDVNDVPDLLEDELKSSMKKYVLNGSLWLKFYMKETSCFGTKQREGLKKKKVDLPEFCSPCKSDSFCTPLN